MGAWLPVIAGIIQIIFLVMKNKIDENDFERKRKEKLQNDWKEVIKSGDIVRINEFLSRMRQ